MNNKMSIPDFYDHLLKIVGETDAISAVNKIEIEMAALRNQNKDLKKKNEELKQENERLKNTILRCPCGKKLRLPQNG